ncbi:protein FLX-like 1 [Salvia divinorum]|uniref:Protein FLX-like 1 n=1 Tax=Salvia divinorum TaxID=28513 RepID=A0ABD1I7L6_SALDI
MSARNRGPPIPSRGVLHGELPHTPILEPRFPRGIRGPTHPASHKEVREAHYSLSGPRQLPPLPAIVEERLAVQHGDIQALLIDNQRLAATHVALKQELEVTQYELQRADTYTQSLHAEKGLQTRELHEKSVKMENELNAVNAMRSELMQVHMDVKELTAGRQDLTAQLQMMTQDLGRVTSDLQQVPAVKAEMEGLRHEMERVRAAIEHEKNSFAESFEHGKVMESKLVTMAREMEKLRAELANTERRAPARAPVGLSGVGYNANYVNPESGYPGNPYPAGYGMMPTNSMHPAPAAGEGYPPYGPGAGAWSSYDPQLPH